MEKYLVHNADTLEEMLAASSDFKERRHIRGALRELKGLKLEGDSVVTYSFGPESVKHILSPRDRSDCSQRISSPPNRLNVKPILSPRDHTKSAQHISSTPDHTDPNKQVVSPRDHTSSAKHILSPQNQRKESLARSILKQYVPTSNEKTHGFKEKSSWKNSNISKDDNSCRSGDLDVTESNLNSNKSTSNEHIKKFRSYLYAGSLKSSESQGTSVFHENAKPTDHVTVSNETERNLIKRPASASLSYSLKDPEHISVFDKQKDKILKRPVNLTISSVNGDKSSAKVTSPNSRPPPVPRKPRKISYRTSPFSSSSTSPFSPLGHSSPRNNKISLKTPKLEGIRSKSAQGSICGSNPAALPGKSNTFFPNMKSDNARNGVSDSAKRYEEDSVFENEVSTKEKISESVSTEKCVSAINNCVSDSNMSRQNGFNQDNVNTDDVEKENIILNRTEKCDCDVNEGKITPRKKSTLSRKNRVNSDSYKDKLTNQRHKDDVPGSPRVVTKPDSVHSGSITEERPVRDTDVAVDVHSSTTATEGVESVQTPHRKLPEVPASLALALEDDDETVHARTMRLLQERKKDRHKIQPQGRETPDKSKLSKPQGRETPDKSKLSKPQGRETPDKSKLTKPQGRETPDKSKLTKPQGRETPDKSKLSPSEIKKFLEEKLERSDSKKKAVRVRRELQLLNRENELKSPRPLQNGDLSKEPGFDKVFHKRKLVQRSKSDVVKSGNVKVEAEEKVDDTVDGSVEYKSGLIDQIEAQAAEGPLSPVSKINIIGSLMQEEAKLQEMLRKSSNFSEKRKMRMEIRRLREKRVELENFSNNKTSEVTVKRCASVTAGLITPATLPDNCHIDTLNKPNINDLRKQLSETADYDEKKKIRLALRHLRQRQQSRVLSEEEIHLSVKHTTDGSVTGLQRSQSFALEKSSQPVCNGDAHSAGPPVTRSQSVTDLIHNSHNTATTTAASKHDSGLPNGHVPKTNKELDKPSEQTGKTFQFRQPNASNTQINKSVSSRGREELKSGRVSAPLPQDRPSSLKGGTNNVKEAGDILLDRHNNAVHSAVKSDSISLGPTTLSRKHSIDSINSRQKSEQDGNSKLLERCKFFENDVNISKTEQTSKQKPSNILISRADVIRDRITGKTTPVTSVTTDNKTIKEDILKASDSKKPETDNKYLLNQNDAKDSDRKLSPSLLWLEDKRKSLPTIRDIDKLMSTMDIEAAFSEILDAVDTDADGDNAVVTKPTLGTADIPMEEEEVSESSVNEELEAIENQRNAENNIKANIQDQHEINGEITKEKNAESETDKELTVKNGSKIEECNNNDNSAIIHPGIIKSEAKIQLSNLSLTLPAAKSEPNSAISVLHGDDGTVTVSEVTKVQEGDTTITEWKKIRRTQSRTETRETDTVTETKASSPGGSSTVYEKDVSKTKKKLTSRGSEYFSRNNYNIKRVKDPEGSETVLHELSSENKNLSVSKNESWGDKSEATVVLKKNDEVVPTTDVNSIEAKIPQISGISKPRNSVTRSTSVCKIQLSNSAVRRDGDNNSDNTLEAQLGRPSGCPNITSPLSDISSVEGSTARLECVVKCSPPPTTAWFKGGNQLTEGEDTKFGFDRISGKAWLELCPVRLGHIGVYKCEFENDRGSASTKSKVSVKVKPCNPPSFLTKLEDVSVREGQPLTLQCTVADTDTVTWYKDGIIQPNIPDFRQTFDGQSAKMEITELFLDDSGTYTCTLRRGAGEINMSCEIEVTESQSTHEVFPSFLTKPETQIADEDDTVIFECDIIGSPTPDVSWLLNGSPLTGNQGHKLSYDGRLARLIMKRVTTKDSGKLECVAANSCGRVSADCQLVVKAVKIEPKITRTLEDLTVGAGKVAILECCIVGSSADDISWSKNGCMIGKTFDFKQTYSDNMARLEIANVCQADAGCYECTVTMDCGSSSSSCMLTIDDAAESQPEEPPQLTVQEEKVQTATVKKFPARYVPKVNEDKVKAAKSQASKVMLVRQNSWKLPGSEKTETPLKRAGSWQSKTRNSEKSATHDKSQNEPILSFKATDANSKTKDERKVVGDSEQVVEFEKMSVKKSDVDHNENNIASVNLKDLPKVHTEVKVAERETPKVEVETLKVVTESFKLDREIPRVHTQAETPAVVGVADKKHEILENNNTEKVDNNKVPLCSASKEDSDIRPKMKFKVGGEIRRTQSVRTAGSEKPEWLQVKLRSVGASRSPLSVKEKQSIEKSYGQSDNSKVEQVETNVTVEKDNPLLRSQSARIPDKPALRDSTNSPSNDPNKSVPKLTPVSERAKLFQRSGKSNPSDIIAKAISLSRAESMRTPVGRSGVNIQRSHSFNKTAAPTASGDVTLDLSPQQSKGQEEEKGELGSSPKVIKYWDPFSAPADTMSDYSRINDEEELNKILSKTENFEERKKIRGRLKELRERHMQEWEAKRQAQAPQEDEIKKRHREADLEKKKKLEAYQVQARKEIESRVPVEDEIKKRHREADLEKKKKLEAFQQQAKSGREESKHLESAEQRLREKHRQADENKAKQLEAYDRMARKEDMSQTSTSQTNVSNDGRTTTTTRKVETVTKVGGAGARPAADQLAPVMMQQIINATSPHMLGGSLTVKTESWSSKDGVTNTSEKTESWGGRGGAKNMFKAMDAKTNPGGAAKTGGAIMRSPSAIKTMLLEWTKAMTREYIDTIEITNFSTSWNDGIAFCALIHHFYPDAFDFNSLDAKNRRQNFELAFDTAEKLADIAPLLDVEDMVKMKKPDWKCVFTYVQSFYRKLQKHERNRAMPLGS